MGFGECVMDESVIFHMRFRPKGQAWWNEKTSLEFGKLKAPYGNEAQFAFSTGHGANVSMSKWL